MGYQSIIFNFYTWYPAFLTSNINIDLFLSMETVAIQENIPHKS